MIPRWLHEVSIAYLAFGVICALAIARDLIHHPQKMWIMNIVWPVTALFGTAWIVGQYLNYGRLAQKPKPSAARAGAESPQNRRLTTPFPMIVANGTLHCGAGCTLGDIAAEWLVFLVPAVAAAFGWRALYGERLYAEWILDFILAYGFGIIFQYFTIAPMRQLPVGRGLIAAIKADTLSLTAWQLGMYGFMAVAYFLIFQGVFDIKLDPDMPEFWFMMQIAMLCGFATSYPVNWWLIKKGWKETM